MLRTRGVLSPILLLAGMSASQGLGQQTGPDEGSHDWPQFGFDSAGSGYSPAPTNITPGNLASAKGRQIRIDGTVDASPIYLRDVTVKGAKHDVFFMTTSYGKTFALDADRGDVLWEFTPPNHKTWEGTRQITNSTPAADPDREHIYAAAPDGTVEKLAVADGHVLWGAAITLLPAREKIASPLRVFRGHVIAVTGGYIGDRPPYQGHVAILDAQSGRLLHVWNSLCSDRTGLMEPGGCAAVRSAIWGRAGPVIEAATGNIFVATGNGSFDGKNNWGDSVIELDPDATKMLGSFTPADHPGLDRHDLDLGSTSPVFLGGGLLAQGGKDRLIRLLNTGRMAGGGKIDRELQTFATPSNAMLFTAPAVWRPHGDTWIFAADGGGTAAWIMKDGKLQQAWKNSTGGTSPVFAGDMLYVYDPREGGLHVYNPVNGAQFGNLQCGRGHWNSPIVIDGRILLPEGNANQHSTTGVVDLWTLPGTR